MKKIVICGVTGNVGKQTLDVIRDNYNEYQIVGISFHNNSTLANQIIEEFNVPFYYCSKDNIKGNTNSFFDLINKAKPDLVLNSLPGLAGLKATIDAIKSKTSIALANKESLVCCGQFVTKLAKENNVKIIPVDSEHSAIYAIINALNVNNISDYQITITASGGPFYKVNNVDINQKTYEQSLKNPNWNMGEKVSIDSATMLNKVFELIECYWLFNNKNVSAICDRKSFIHGFISNDNSCFAFKSKPDMHLPIEIALKSKTNDWNDIKQKYIISTNINELKKEFQLENINAPSWSCYHLKDIMLNDLLGPTPIVANAADEILINLFKNKKIRITDFYPIILDCINKFKNNKVTSIDDVYNLHNEVQLFLNKKFN